MTAMNTKTRPAEAVAPYPSRTTLRQRPREDSNLRTRFRKPLLYPLSYGGRGPPDRIVCPTTMIIGNGSP